MNGLFEYKGYHAKIDIDVENKIFIGTVIGINDVLSFHGSSYEELEQVFKQSINNYLEMCAHFGKDPEKEYRGSFNVRISPDLHKKADLAAKAKGITLNQYVSSAIENSFDSDALQNTVIYWIPYKTTKKQFKYPVDHIIPNTSNEFNFNLSEEVALDAEERCKHIKCQYMQSAN